MKLPTLSVSQIIAKITNIKLGLKKRFNKHTNIPGLLVNAFPIGAAFSVSFKIFSKDLVDQWIFTTLFPS
jgi:hypothetical protein